MVQRVLSSVLAAFCLHWCGINSTGHKSVKVLIGRQHVVPETGAVYDVVLQPDFIYVQEESCMLRPQQDPNAAYTKRQ